MGPEVPEDSIDGDLARRLKVAFQEIAERYEFEIDTMEVNEDHVHLFFDGASSVFLRPQVVQILKSVSARMMFKEFSKIKKQLWGGELWNDGYFVRSVGTKLPQRSYAVT